MEVVVADIGGTHARFAIAELRDDRVASLGQVATLKTADYASLQTAWASFGAQIGRPLPRQAALAVACPISGEVLKLTNSPWTIVPKLLTEQLAVDRLTLVNDFGAVAHAIGQIEPDHLAHLSGPDRPLGETETVTIVGAGTGLGVAHVVRRNGFNHVVESEGGHIDFAPLDAIEDAILQRLRQRYRRVSVERIVSGPGLLNIYEALAAIEGRATRPTDDKALWTLALAGSDDLAAAALDHFCRCLGGVAGDIALAQGGTFLVLGGGLAPRLIEVLARSGFAQRFVAKGRFEAMMASIPVKILTHSQPGLLGAAAAFLAEHGDARAQDMISV